MGGLRGGGLGEMGMDEEGGAVWIWGGIVAVGGVGEGEMDVDGGVQLGYGVGSGWGWVRRVYR